MQPRWTHGSSSLHGYTLAEMRLRCVVLSRATHLMRPFVSLKVTIGDTLTRRCTWVLNVLVCLMLTAMAHAEAGARQQVEVGGIGIDFRIEPLQAGGALREGQQVRFRFTLTDATTGISLVGVSPAAWMDLLPPEESRDPDRCLNKVRHFLGGSLLA